MTGRGIRNQVKELESSEDAELLAAVREGNDAAFGELYRRHVGASRAAVRALTRSTADADDAVAEAFARVLAVMRRGGGPEVAMRPYLMTVVRNVCYDRASRDRETLPGETEVIAALDDLPTSHQNAELDRFTEANLVSRAFASLSDRWKHVLWQTDIEGRTPPWPSAPGRGWPTPTWPPTSPIARRRSATGSRPSWLATSATACAPRSR
jgi:RNA polymerase sigma factor (sigma-70 family)